MEQSDSIVNLATAIVGAQGSTQQAAKDSTNPFSAAATPVWRVAGRLLPRGANGGLRLHSPPQKPRLVILR